MFGQDSSHADAKDFRFTVASSQCDRAAGLLFVDFLRKLSGSKTAERMMDEPLSSLSQATSE